MLLIVLVTSIRSKILDYGTEKYNTGIDVGSMLIINDLVAGRNISYSRVDEHGFTKEYEIELFTESAQWTEHETDLMCKVCHTYSTKYLQKGG
jgi:hypothetical protein